LYNLKPGLTGIGSIVFRNEEEILQQLEDKKYFHKEIINPYKGMLECWYADHDSMTNYIKVIFITVITVLNSNSSIWKKAFKDLPPMPPKLQPYI
jgi:lipopolysaccharide/colanic/teichoic acid biosynthesis glycosyltransferase